MKHGTHTRATTHTHKSTGNVIILETPDALVYLNFTHEYPGVME